MRKNKKSLTAKKIVNVGLLLAVALIVSLIENMLPPLVPVMPYAKLGLGNVVLLFCFLLVGWREGMLVLVLRCVLTAVFSGNYVALLWSLPSGIVAYCIMIFMIKSKLFSVPATSAMGGIAHNFTQIIVASVIIGNSVFWYLPYMLLLGGLCGLFTGLSCHYLSLALGGKFGLKEYTSKSDKIKSDVFLTVLGKNRVKDSGSTIKDSGGAVKDGGGAVKDGGSAVNDFGEKDK